MKILVILTFCLIAKIRSYTYERRREQPLLDFLGYVNTTDEEVDHFNRVLCEKNGGSQAYDDFVNAMQEYATCSKAVHFEMYENGTYINSDWYFRKVCTKRPKFLNCLKNFTDSAKTCFDSSKHEAVDQLYNALPSISQFLCEDDALRLRSTECLNPEPSELSNCANNTLARYVRETVSDGAEAGGIGIYNLLLVPDATKCTVFNDFRTCTLNFLKDCPNVTTVADLATPIFEIVNNAMSCDRLVRSTTAPTDIVDDVS